MVIGVKDIIEVLRFLWLRRKTKAGLLATYLIIAVLWFLYVYTPYHTNQNLFVPYTGGTAILMFGIYLLWLINSARMVVPRDKFTIAFALREKDHRGTSYLQDALSQLERQLDILKLLPKFRILRAGSDVIRNMRDALRYREKHDLDLVIWGDIYTGKKDGKEMCDINELFFTIKVPGAVVAQNYAHLFTEDVNIALINRDWNVYEMNSIPDVEKISGHLAEIIMFIVGLTYCVAAEEMEDSIAILENLLRLLEAKTKGEAIVTLPEKSEVKMSIPMLRKGRVQAIVLQAYKKMGIYHLRRREYSKAHFYFEKYSAYERRDSDVLGALSLCAFHRGDIEGAKGYTEKICGIDKNNIVYLVNSAFFYILEGKYDTVLVLYKRFLRSKSVGKEAVATQVIAFLDQRKTENTEELAYDFGIGFLNCHFCNSTHGEAELKEFLEKAKDKKEYAAMVSYTIQQLFPEQAVNKSKKKKQKARK